MIYGIIILVWLLIAFTAIRILRMGAWEDYKRAEWKCSKCKHYTGSNPQYRLIYCDGCSRTPEEALECKGDRKC